MFMSCLMMNGMKRVLVVIATPPLKNTNEGYYTPTILTMVGKVWNKHWRY